MFKLRNCTILCTKWALLIFDACYRSQNSWTGACLPWCSIFSSFQNSLKTSGHRGYEFLEFWFGIWSYYFLTQVSSCWRVHGHLWCVFSLMMHQMFSIGERSGLQAGQFSTQTLLLQKPCCCNNCSMWFCIVLLKYMSSEGEHMLL